MRFSYKVFLASIMNVLLIYVVLMTCIDVIAFHRPFYNYEYEHLNTAETLKMSDTDLYVATDTLLDYLKGYRSDINVRLKVDDEVREVFDAREKAHMVDVKYLYQDAMLVRNVGVVVIIGLFLFLYYDNKKEIKEVLSISYRRVFVGFVFVLCVILLYAAGDFTAFWTRFHTIFFNNDLWLLDPDTSLMINMFPETFFYHLVILIVAAFALIHIILFIMCQRYLKRLLKSVE